MGALRLVEEPEEEKAAPLPPIAESPLPPGWIRFEGRAIQADLEANLEAHQIATALVAVSFLALTMIALALIIPF